jgi:phosphoesterase RecJ-like protein
MSIEISPLIKEKAPLILTEIQKAKSILLHCHPSPDPDSVGSALAMKFAIEQLGKKATVIKGDSEIPEAFMHFPGAKEIVRKKFAEIYLGDFDLFIILDAGTPGMISFVNTPIFPLPIRTVVIDHHSTNTSFADVNLVEIPSPATAFMLFQLFKEWNITFDKHIALNLFMGMYTDTGGFKYPPTDYRVFEAAAELAKIVPDYTKCIFTMENSDRKESLYFAALALNSIQTFCKDHVAIASVSYESIQSKHIPLEAIGGDNMANRLKSVIGWNIGVIMIETEPGKVKVSMRSRDPELYDVSKLAVALGGGGHRAAAGIKLSMSLDEARVAIVAKAGELYTF